MDFLRKTGWEQAGGVQNGVAGDAVGFRAYVRLVDGGRGYFRVVCSRIASFG